MTDAEIAEHLALAHNIGFEAGKDAAKARIRELEAALRFCLEVSMQYEGRMLTGYHASLAIKERAAAALKGDADEREG